MYMYIYICMYIYIIHIFIYIHPFQYFQIEHLLVYLIVQFSLVAFSEPNADP